MKSNSSSFPLRILTVEDNEHDRLAFQRAFRKSGVPVTITEYIRAEGALEYLKTEASSVDIVVTDYKLPGISGLAFCKELLAQGIVLPMILLTGAGSEHLAVEALKIGVNDYLIKDPNGGYLSLLPVVIPEVVRQFGDRLARRQAEEQLRKLSMAVEQSPIITVITDVQGNIEYVNPGFTRVTGYTRKEVTGHTPRILRTDRQSQEFYKELWETITSGSEWWGELCNKKKDGTLYWELASICPIRNTEGEITHFLKVGENITERKRAEEKMQEMNKELEQKLILSEKMATLGRLVAEVTHEINTPVSIGITASSNLIEKIKTLKKLYLQGEMTRSNLEAYLKVGEEISEIILSNLNKTANLIRSFKIIAVDQCREEQRHFRLKDYLDEILLSLKPKLKKTQHVVTIRCPSDIELDSDPGALSQIMNNLVINSLLHGFERKEKGEIVIDVHQDKEKILFVYSDNGKGITQEHLEKIFDPFFTTRRGKGGSGIGLNVVYKLVTQKLHGHIECESTPGVGTVFTIQIPLEKR